jgi:hypothetical protein
MAELEITQSIPTYNLSYKKNIYTLEEAKAALEKKESIESNPVVISSGNTPIFRIPCQSV